MSCHMSSHTLIWHEYQYIYTQCIWWKQTCTHWSVDTLWEFAFSCFERRYYKQFQKKPLGHHKTKKIKWWYRNEQDKALQWLLAKNIYYHNIFIDPLLSFCSMKMGACMYSVALNVVLLWWPKIVTPTEYWPSHCSSKITAMSNTTHSLSH